MNIELGTRPEPTPGLLTAYYLGTPLFVVLDLLGWPVRVADSLEGLMRWGWYAALLALGLLCWARPRAAPLVGMLESSFNLTLVLLSVLLPIWNMALDVDAPLGPVAFGPQRALTVLLSGAALIVAFQRSQWHWWQGRR